MQLVHIVGKFNNQVAILLTNNMVNGLDVLVQTRQKVGISVSNIYLFAVVSVH